ncbi:phage portal protein, partial [Undibacterium luofuense]|uniref:phage portal protein n=1 Tax=Undibacterium luofuense TaxID=2828733 RepID=UPI003C6FEC62
MQKLRDRSRDTRRNEWAGESLVQKWSTTLIGIGIVPRFTRVKGKDRRQQINDLHRQFVATSDAD